jgi:hypothetical protein
MTTIPDPASEPDEFESNDWLGETTGDTCVGEVTARESHHSKKYGTDFDVLVVRNGDGKEKRVPCARAHLAQLVEKYDPQVGDGVAITFFGEKPDGYGFRYAMRVAKAQAEGAKSDDDIPF